MKKAFDVLRGMARVTVRAIRRPGITTATERYLWISAWCLSGFAVLFGLRAWLAVSILLAFGWSLGLYLNERNPTITREGGLRLVHDDVDEEGVEPSRLEDTGT